MDIDQFGNVITEKNGKLQLITEKSIILRTSMAHGSSL